MKHIRLRECPFCSGPPAAFCSRDDDPDDMAAYVFCHECGAQGPTVDPLFSGIEPNRDALLEAAADLWNVSDARNASLYHPDRATLTVPTSRDAGNEGESRNG